MPIGNMQHCQGVPHTQCAALGGCARVAFGELGADMGESNLAAVHRTPSAQHTVGRVLLPMLILIFSPFLVSGLFVGAAHEATAQSAFDFDSDNFATEDLEVGPISFDTIENFRRTMLASVSPLPFTIRERIYGAVAELLSIEGFAPTEDDIRRIAESSPRNLPEVTRTLPFSVEQFLSVGATLLEGFSAQDIILEADQQLIDNIEPFISIYRLKIAKIRSNIAEIYDTDASENVVLHEIRLINQRLSLEQPKNQPPNILNGRVDFYLYNSSDFQLQSLRLRMNYFEPDKPGDIVYQGFAQLYYLDRPLAAGEYRDLSFRIRESVFDLPPYLPRNMLVRFEVIDALPVQPNVWINRDRSRMVSQEQAKLEEMTSYQDRLVQMWSAAQNRVELIAGPSTDEYYSDIYGQ